MSADRSFAQTLTTLAAPLVGELFDLLPDTVFFLKDRDGRYVIVNMTLVERCGRRCKSDLLGRTVADVFPAKLAESYASQDRRVIQSGTAIANKLELHLYPNHRPGWCVTTKLPLRDPAGRIVGLAGLSRDLQAAAEAVVSARLHAAIDLIAESFVSKLTMTNLAEHAGLGLKPFSRIVKRIFRVTPSQLLLQTRLQAAAQRLRDTGEPLSAVAQACGFYDQSAFSRQFKQASGLTPLAYRRSLGAQRKAVVDAAK